MSARVLAVLFCVLHGGETACVGDDCANPDSAEMLLTTKARFGSGRQRVSEESRLNLYVPKLAKLTNDMGLPNLIELEDTVERMLDDEVNKSGNLTGNLTGLERSYNPTVKNEEVLQDVRNYLDDFLAATREAHKSAQKSINDNADQVKEVNREMTTRWAYVTQLREQMEANQANHRTCRAAQAVVKRKRVTQCGIFEKHQLQATTSEGYEALESVLKLLKKTPKTAGDMATLYEDLEKASEYFGPKKTCPECTCQENNAALLLQEAAVTSGTDDTVVSSGHGCKENTDLEESTKNLCKSNQTLFEMSDCAWHKENDEVCDWYKQSFDYETQWIENQRSIYENSEMTRKAEHVAAKRVQCYLDVLVADQVNKSEMVRNCRNTVHSVGHLTLIFPSLEEKKYDCDIRGAASDDQTCGANWLQSEYTGRPWYTDATTEACTACPTPAPTPAPTTEAQYKGYHSRLDGWCYDGVNNAHTDRFKCTGYTEAECADLCSSMSCAGFAYDDLGNCAPHPADYSNLGTTPARCVFGGAYSNTVVTTSDGGSSNGNRCYIKKANVLNIEVLSIKNVAANTGLYFQFNWPEALTRTVGKRGAVNVKQCRGASQVWEGEVMMDNNGNDWTTLGNGRRNTGKDNGQWQIGDIVTTGTTCEALPKCSDSIRYTITTTNSALCAGSTGHQVEYVGRACGLGQIEWTSATAITRKAGTENKQCSWDWTTHASREYYAGSCGVAPTVDGGSRLPTKCVQA